MIQKSSLIFYHKWYTDVVTKYMTLFDEYVEGDKSKELGQPWKV